MQQTSMRPTRNLVVMPRTTRMNPSQTKTSKEDSSHLKQTTRLHSHSNSHHPRKAAKKTPSSMDHDTIRKGVHRANLQSQQIIGLKDQLPQHQQHKLEDHHRLPKPPIQTTRIHQNAITPLDPPRHLCKAQVLPNQRRHRQVQVLLISFLHQQKTLSYVLDVAKVATGARTVHIRIFVIFVG